MKSKKILIIAPNLSGDLIGAGIARAIINQDNTIEIIGVGGPEMARAGVNMKADFTDSNTILCGGSLLPIINWLNPFNYMVRKLKKIYQGEI